MVDTIIASNVNSTAVTSIVPINDATATVISLANPRRRFFHVALDPTLVSAVAFIRLYPAATDNIAHGIPMRIRQSGNDSIFMLSWQMPERIYDGEISAISLSDPFDLYVTEY